MALIEIDALPFLNMGIFATLNNQRVPVSQISPQFPEDFARDLDNPVFCQEMSLGSLASWVEPAGLWLDCEIRVVAALRAK
jgi:hypothetical protein